MPNGENLAGLLDSWGPGVALGVVDSSGPRVLRGDGATTFPIASVSKLITALGCLVAVEEGTLQLDSPAGPPGSTLRHLLAHASGLDFDSEMVVAPPGTRRIYSNSGFDALGAHLAASSAIRWQDYIREAVLDPLGMAATTLEGSPARSFHSTLSDLLAFACELLTPALIAASTLSEATTAQFPDLDGVLPGFGTQRPNPWGLGFELKGTKSPHWTGSRNSPATFGHFGASGTFLWVDPTLGVGLVGLGTRAFGPWAVELWPRIADTVIGDRLD